MLQGLKSVIFFIINPKVLTLFIIMKWLVQKCGPSES